MLGVFMCDFTYSSDPLCRDIRVIYTLPAIRARRHFCIVSRVYHGSHLMPFWIVPHASRGSRLPCPFHGFTCLPRFAFSMTFVQYTHSYGHQSIVATLRITHKNPLYALNFLKFVPSLKIVPQNRPACWVYPTVSPQLSSITQKIALFAKALSDFFAQPFFRSCPKSQDRAIKSPCLMGISNGIVPIA